MAPGQNSSVISSSCCKKIKNKRLISTAHTRQGRSAQGCCYSVLSARVDPTLLCKTTRAQEQLPALPRRWNGCFAAKELSPQPSTATAGLSGFSLRGEVRGVPPPSRAPQAKGSADASPFPRKRLTPAAPPSMRRRERPPRGTEGGSREAGEEHRGV